MDLQEIVTLKTARLYKLAMRCDPTVNYDLLAKPHLL